jgi:hypothetical protein
MIDEAIRTFGAQFSPEAYLFWTRIQCLAWTGADLVIVFYLLRIANLARRLAGQRPHVVSFIVLWTTLLFVPVVTVAPTGRMIFYLELIITVPHFLIILYVLAADARGLATALHTVLNTRGETQRHGRA